MSEYVVDFSKVATKTTGELEGFDRSRATLMFLVREEIVRCRDCKHYTDDEMEYYHYCVSWCEQVTPYGYCAWGERRADERD